MKVQMVKVLYFLLFHSNKKGMELVPWVDPDVILRTKVMPDLEVCLSALFNTTLHMKFHLQLCELVMGTMNLQAGTKCHKSTQFLIACNTVQESPVSKLEKNQIQPM